jgi:uncharacterized OB-fold protein
MRTETTAPAVPSPLMHGYTKEFYDCCARRELRFQRCLDCSVWRHPPRPMCGGCQSMRWEWALTRGRGKVYCWTVVHQALHPAFANAVPYAAAIIELDEGPRIASWVTGLPPHQLAVGMAVEVWFDETGDGLTLPKFRPAPAA